MKIIPIPCLTDNYSYMVCDEQSLHCIVVDPSEAQPVLDFLKTHPYKLDAIWSTHHHFDHIGGNLELKNLFPELKIFGFAQDAHRIPGITHLLREGDSVIAFQLENEFQIIAFPGHTLGHCGYYSERLKVLFCGDTLFAGGCGRLFEGTAEQLFHTLMHKIALLDPNTLIFCGHEYTLNNLQFALRLEPNNPHLQKRFLEVQKLRYQNQPSLPSLLSEELLTNPFLRAHSLEIKESIEKITGVKTNSPLELFTQIRQLKDRS